MKGRSQGTGSRGAASWVGACGLLAALVAGCGEGDAPDGPGVAEQDLTELGLIDGTPNAVGVLALLDDNDTTVAVLDVDAGLDKRAVESIFAAREIVSLLELASLHYVGQSAMLKLRTFAKTYTGPTGPKKGYWEECGAHEECEENLCVGLLSSDQGWCAEAWQANTFSSSQVVAIPDGGPAASSDITVSGLASVPMDVIVTLDIDHPRPQDLHVGLHQPGGAYAVLWNNHPSPPSVVEQPLGVEFDNMVNGVWRLEVLDTATGEVGTIDGWSMWISSRWD